MNAETTFLPLLGQIFNSAIPASGVEELGRLVSVAIAFLFWAGSLAGLIYLIHFFLTLPMRRAERARLFLDLLESALSRGQSVEEMILSIARSRDRTLGVRFHLLAAHIESGLRFATALEKVPRFLPPQISAMLRAGEKLGDLRRVLPACREILQDRPAAVRSAMHYMVLVVLFFSPVFVLVVTMTMIFVVPRFKEVAAGSNATLWPLTQFVFAHTAWLVGFELILFLLLAAATVLYIGGPQLCPVVSIPQMFHSWTGSPGRCRGNKRGCSGHFPPCWPCCSMAACRKPRPSGWRAIARPTKSAATAPQRVIAALEQGTKLDDAVRAFDDTGEFHWRLTNATHARGGFLNALRGWHEALDAKAFQQEEATAHAVTSGLVILNGLVVALIATAMFGMLVAHVERSVIIVMKTKLSLQPIADRLHRERGFLMVDLIVGMAILTLAIMPLAFSFVRERQLLRAEYFRARRRGNRGRRNGDSGRGRMAEFPGRRAGLYTVHAKAAASLPPGHFQLTKTGNHLRLEWKPDKRQGIGTVVREITVK